MKRILFVYHASNIGGGTYCLLNILKEIDRNKYQPTILLRTKGDLVTEIEASGIEVYYMPSMTLVPYNRPLFGRGVLNAYRRIKQSYSEFKGILDKICPEAVYINTMMLAPYIAIAKKKGCKTVIHLREHWPLNENKIQLSRLQTVISENADQIVAINSYSASMIPTREVTLVHDWIDLSKRYEYRPFDEIFKEDASKLKVYLFTGGIQLIKGTVEVINIFRNSIKGAEKRLLIVGVDPKPNTNGTINKLKLILSKVGIKSYEYKVRDLLKKDDRIVCIPALYALKHIMQQAYCNLSYFTVPHANLALAESIIAGTIPIAAKTPESIEYSNGGELAVLYELGNSDDLISKLKYLDCNYTKIKSLIEKNGYLIEELFDKSRNVALLNAVFDKLFE